MEERNLEEIKKRLLSRLPTSDGDAVSDATFDLEMFCLLSDVIPDEVFSFLESTLFSGLAHESKHSNRLLSFFDSEWRKLSTSQKRRILHLIKVNYCRYTDWMAWFTITEILGEGYSDRWSLSITKHLKRVCKREGPRSMIPHAFEHHVTDSRFPLVRRRAMRELSGMLNEKSKKVRSEVKTSLRRIKIRRLSRFSSAPLLPRKAS